MTTRKAPAVVWRAIAALAIAAALTVAALVALAPSSSDAASSPPPSKLPATSPQTGLTMGWTKGKPVAVADGVRYTRWTETHPDPRRPTPRVLDVLTMDPAVGAVTLDLTFGSAAGTAEPTSKQLEAATEALGGRAPLAGVNGGFFTSEPTHPDLGVPTIALAGVAVRNGDIHGAACWNNGRGNNAAVLRDGVPYITNVSTRLSISLATDATVSATVDDVNRNPGRVPVCARDDGDLPTVDKLVFRDADEIIMFTDDYGVPVPKPGVDPSIKEDDAGGFEVTLGADGVVTKAVATRGGVTRTDKVRVPRGGRMLQGIGTGAAWLSRNATVGTKLAIAQTVVDLRTNKPIPLDSSVDIVNGTHPLVRDGKPVEGIPATCKDAIDPEGKLCTDSRTVIGVDVSGRTVLATLTGIDREDGGLLAETAQLLADDQINIVDALNLDGGGSTTMMVGKDRTTTVTDLVGGVRVERPVANALYICVAGYGLYDVPRATLY